MTDSVLLVVIFLNVCNVRAEGIDKEIQQSPTKAGLKTESQAEMQDQREEGKVFLSENNTENKHIELIKAEKNISNMSFQLQIHNMKINNPTDKSENKTEIGDKKYVKISDLSNLHAVGENGKTGIQIGSNMGDIYLTEDSIESTTLAFDDSEAHDTTNLGRRSDDDVAFGHQEPLQNKKAYSRRRENYKIRTMTAVRDSPKIMQRRTFNFWSLVGMGDKKEQVVRITKEVPVFVPYKVEKKIPVPVIVQIERKIPVTVLKPYPVPVEKKVYYAVKEYMPAPYPVYKKVPYLIKVMIEKPFPVHVSKPYPVYIEKKVPYAVEKEVTYPLKVPVERPVPVHIPVVKNVFYPVEKQITYPVEVPVEQPISVPVEKPYPGYMNNKVKETLEAGPFPTPVEESIEQHLRTHDFVSYNNNKKEFDTSEIDKILNEGQLIGNQYTKDYSFNSQGLRSDHHDRTRIRDKNDAGDKQNILQSKAEEKFAITQLALTTEILSTSTKLFTPEKKNQNREGEERSTEEKINVSDFGRKIK